MKIGGGIKRPSVHRLSVPKPSAHTHVGVKSMEKFTAPHNRAKHVSTIPKGAPGAKSGTTTPKLGKQMSVADILHMHYPKIK